MSRARGPALPPSPAPSPDRPARSSSAASARLAAVPPGAVEGVNDFGRRGYRGPCPPHGAAHHYHFVVLALDTRLGLAAGARRPDIWTPASAVTCWAGANWSPPTGAPERVRASASEPGPASRSEVPILLRHRSQSAANKPAARAREPPIWRRFRSACNAVRAAPNWDSGAPTIRCPCLETAGVFPGGLAGHSIVEPANVSNPPVTGGNNQCACPRRWRYCCGYCSRWCR